MVQPLKHILVSVRITYRSLKGQADIEYIHVRLRYNFVLDLKKLEGKSKKNHEFKSFKNLLMRDGSSN